MDIFFNLLVLMMAVAAMGQELDPVDDQIALYRNRTNGPIGILTTSVGRPVDYNDAATLLNKRIIYDEYYMDRISHHVRERIPERLMNPKGAGAFGYFEVTHNITDITKAKFLNQIGKRTPIAMRFSSLIIEKGGNELFREPKGFAVKLYTEDGNLDFAGLNIPVFAVKDPVQFPNFIAASRRNPATNLLDPNMFWDFITLNPESLHQIMYTFSDRGIPDGYRHMPGLSIHTYQMVNDCGETHFVRFHSIPDCGIKNLCSEEAIQLSIQNPDYATKDLYEAIANCDYPSWSVYIQVVSRKEALKADCDIFDVTRILPECTYPLRPVGKLVLDRNPLNYFAEIEQLAFNPANIVPGISGAPDKLFESRLLAYRESQAYRLGGNYNKIPVNCPHQRRVYNYIRDGEAPVNDNGNDAPNYYPNSFNGPQPYAERNRVELVRIHENAANNFDQIRDFYLSLEKDEQSRTISRILKTLAATTDVIQNRAVRLFGLIDYDLGNRIRKGLQGNETSGVPITF